MRQWTAVNTPQDTVTGLILAGGRGRRMGGLDKGLVELQGISMTERVAARLLPQVDSLLINANRNLEDYQRLGYPVIADTLGEFYGPLAGMASGLQAARTALVMSVPCDSPLLAGDLVARMRARRTECGAEIAVAHDGERMHPVFCLLPTQLAHSIRDFLQQGGRKIDQWFSHHRLTVVDFSDQPEAFVNVNRDEDRQVIEQLIRRQEGD